MAVDLDFNIVYGLLWFDLMASCMPSLPPPKRKTLSLSLKKPSRFLFPTAADELRKVCQGYVPKSTERCTNWAVCVFETWRKEQNKKIR